MASRKGSRAPRSVEPEISEGLSISFRGFPAYLAVLGVFFLLLLNTYTVVSGRLLDYQINELVRGQTRLRNEITALETEIAEKETIPRLLAKMEEMNLDLQPCQAPPMPVLAGGLSNQASAFRRTDDQ